MSPSSCCASLLLGLLLITASVASDIRICKTLVLSSNKYHEHRDLDRLYNELRDYVDGCQYVMGDLTIMDLGVIAGTNQPIDENIRNLKTDFLHSIMEISGQLYISHVNIKRIELHSLTMIRGEGAYRNPGVDPSYPIDVRYIVHSTTLSLPSLSAVAKGGIRVVGVHVELYCYLTKMVDWNEQFQSDRWNNGTRRSESNERELSFNTLYVTKNGRQKLITNPDEIQAMCSTLAKCHLSCARNKAGRQTCWSGDSDNCQNLQDCGSHSCQTCVSYRTKEGARSCCNPECVGGCNGVTGVCLSCRNVRVSMSSCTKDCTFKETRIHDLKRAGNVCVKSCKPPFFISSDGNDCLRVCPMTDIEFNGSCYQCNSDGKQCEVGEVSSPHFSDELAAVMKNKRYSVLRMKRDLIVDGTWLHSPSSLGALENLQYLFGQLYFTNMDLLRDNLGFYFLRNLKFVTGPLFLMNVKTRYLGLSRLKHAFPLYAYNISGLCRAWYPANFISYKMAHPTPEKFGVIFISISFDDNSDFCRDAACHPLCSGECWGPGPDMCVH